MNNDSVFQIEEGKCILNAGECENPQCRRCVIPLMMAEDAKTFIEARMRLKS